jgi:hypothetical protein
VKSTWLRSKKPTQENGSVYREIFFKLLIQMSVINAAIVVPRGLKIYLTSLQNVTATLACIANDIDHRCYQNMDAIALPSVSVGIIITSLLRWLVSTTLQELASLLRWLLYGSASINWTKTMV